MLIARPSSAMQSSSESTCMYRASTTTSTCCSATSSSSRSSAAFFVSGVTGTWWKGTLCQRASAAKSEWFDTMAGTSIGNVPISRRNSRSLRQWPSRDTMISTRARRLASWICHSMPNASATSLNPVRSSATPAPADVSACTRMKNRRLYGSPNC